MKRVIIPMPSYGFDPTEVAIPWGILTENNISVTFITPNGEISATDEIMLTGKTLGLWKSVLKANMDAVKAFSRMKSSIEFRNPVKYSDVNESDFDALLLPGGHDKRVKEYLESAILQQLVADFFQSEKPVAAICHGVVLVARSTCSRTNKSVIYEYKTTSLLESQEMLGYRMTRFWLKDYYLTYPGLSVEKEVKSVLSNVDNFIKGPFPLFRDSLNKLKRGFFVRDRNYLSARWPGDAHQFSLEFVKMVNES